jgi:uncharacterized protein YndB with AHSA1/START domain
MPSAELHERFVEKFGLNRGSVEITQEGWVVRFDRQFMGAPVERVWSALSGVGSGDKDMPGPGGSVPEGFTSGEFTPGTVLQVEAPRLLEYEWLSGDRPAGIVRWDLSSGPGGGRLTLTQTGPEELAGERERALSVWQSRITRLARELRDG